MQASPRASSSAAMILFMGYLQPVAVPTSRYWFAAVPVAMQMV
jgi:hypothetical protein